MSIVGQKGKELRNYSIVKNCTKAYRAEIGVLSESGGRVRKLFGISCGKSHVDRSIHMLW